MSRLVLLGLLASVAFCAWNVYASSAEAIREHKRSARDYRKWINDKLAEVVGTSIDLTQECEYLDELPANANEFYSSIVQKGNPVVFRKGLKVYGGKLPKWKDPQYLIDNFGTAEFAASVFDTNRPGERYGRTPVEGGKYLQAPFHDMFQLEDLIRFNRTNRVAFMEQGAIYTNTEDTGGPQEVVPKMFKEWKRPSFAPEIEVESVALWLGRLDKLPKGTPKESPTHYDPVDNLFLQLRGKKQFWMFHANDFAALYPKFMRMRISPNPDDLNGKDRLGSGEELQDNFSPADPRKVYERNAAHQKEFPRTKFARPVMCEVKEGEVLYMPAFTWHNVESYGYPDKDPLKHMLNIGVNTWYAGDSRYKYLFESVMALLQGAGLTDTQNIQDEEILAGSNGGKQDL